MSLRFLRSLRSYSTTNRIEMEKYINSYVNHSPCAYDLTAVKYDENFNKAVFDKLQLKKTYTDPSKLTVLDMFGTPSGFTVGLAEHLDPAQMYLINDKAMLHKFWSGFMEQFPDVSRNMTIYKSDAFKWSTYLDLNKEMSIKPENQPGVPINTSLLIQGNFSNFMGTGFIVQMFSTIQNRNWYQRLGGNVRMLAWVDTTVANKLIADHTTPKYRRAFSLVVEAFSEIKLAAVTEGARAKLDNIDKHDPVILPYPTPDNTVDPKNRNIDVCLVEIIPRADPIVGDLKHWNYVTSKLMVRYAATLEKSLWILGPAAEEHLGPQIPDRMMKTRVGKLTIEDFCLLAQIFADWPFKPNLDMAYAVYTSGEYV